MNYEFAEPKPSSLIQSLRSVGYSLPTAVADIVDNSIAADAHSISIVFYWAGASSFVTITDDGKGMSEDELHQAMRPGSRNPMDVRDASDLGRFGLGLKTASFSQCKKLTVASRRKGGSIALRTWDLDYVADHDEWRLLKTADGFEKHLKALDKLESGTIVCWGTLDRLTEGETTGDLAAQARFNDAIDMVRQHLALTYHRFMEDGSIRLRLNDQPVQPWNPFLEHHPATYKTPEESIPFGQSRIYFRGYVLPHRDMLPEDQYVAAGGPGGWAAHQGFYVYRAKRLLVPGDWIRLGRPNPWTRAEQYNLARIRLDLPNNMDSDWHIDIKKSVARPPALIRDRLTELTEKIRERARSVFVHRGQYGTRIPRVDHFERPWTATIRNGQRIYRVNRDHPAVKSILQKSSVQTGEVESLLRIIEETVPVQQIWLDVAEQSKDPAKPYDGVEFPVIRSDMNRVYQFLLSSGINSETARQRLLTIEPFNRYPELITGL